MAEITLEKLHALVEKLTDYVMTEIAAIKGKLEQHDKRFDQLAQIALRHEEKLNFLDDKVGHIDHNVNLLLEGMDAIAKEQDISRTERAAVSKTLDVYNERIGTPEMRVLGHRVREEEEGIKGKRIR